MTKLPFPFHAERLRGLRKLAWVSALLATAPACIRLAWSQDLRAQFYFMDDAAATQSLQAHSAAIDLLSPAWFYFEPGGKLHFEMDPAVFAWAKLHHVPLMPLVANRGFAPEIVEALLQDGPQTQDGQHDGIRQSAIETLVTTAEAMGFDGLQLDIENVSASRRDAYSQFAAALAAQMHTRKMLLSIAVPAPLTPAFAPGQEPRWDSNPRAAGFDYATLARSADFLSLMTYDEYTSPDAPGPIAGFAWVDACVRAALEFVPGEKLMLGVPLYHRHWAGQQTSEGTHAEAAALAASVKSKPALDPFHQSPTFSFNRDNIKHIIWFENAESLRLRLELVHKYHLAGYSAWRLGQEDTAAWGDVFRSGAR